MTVPMSAFVLLLFTVSLVVSIYQHAHLVSDAGFVRGMQTRMWNFGTVGNTSNCNFSPVKEPLELDRASRRFSRFIYPAVTAAEHNALSLTNDLGYPAKCLENTRWIRVLRQHLGPGFNNKIIAFTNLLYQSRRENYTIVIKPDVYEMMFEHYHADVVQRYFCISFYQPTADQVERYQISYEHSAHRYFWKTAAMELKSSDFRFAVAKHIFLHPKAHIASTVDRILAERDWDHYVCIHVRVGFAPYSYMKKRRIQRMCKYCEYTTRMPSDFVKSLATTYGLADAPLMVMTNDENNTIVQRIEEEFGAVRLVEQDVPGSSLLHVELLLAMFSSLFFGHASSSMSTNIAIVQQAVKDIHSRYIGMEATYANTIFPIPIGAFKR